MKSEKVLDTKINILEEETCPRMKSVYSVYGNTTMSREYQGLSPIELEGKIKNKYGRRKRYEEAYEMARDNQYKYVNKYNEKVERKRIERNQKREYSVYLDFGKTLEHYHETDSEIKNTKLHCVDENPYMYYGFEDEITFDDSATYGYDYCNDEEGDYPSFEDIIEEFDRITMGIFCYELDSTVYNGFEIISRPLSFRAWHDPLIIKCLDEGFAYLKSMGALLEQPDGNGMHIHMSKRFFEAKDNGYGVNKYYNDLGYMVECLPEDFEAVAGRKRNDWCGLTVDRYKDGSSRNHTISDDGVVADNLKLKRNFYNLPYGNHHRAVIHSGETIELRFFRSTVDYKRILANIELASSMANACRDEQLSGKTFKQILSYNKGENTDYLMELAHKEGHKFTSKKVREEIKL